MRLHQLMEQRLTNLANMTAQFRRTTLMFTSCAVMCTGLWSMSRCTHPSVQWYQKKIVLTSVVCGLRNWVTVFGETLLLSFFVYILYTVRMQKSNIKQRKWIIAIQVRGRICTSYLGWSVPLIPIIHQGQWICKLLPCCTPNVMQCSCARPVVSSLL